MHFRYLKNISKGSFGSVDLVEDDNGKEFARKTLLPQRRRDYVHNRIVKRFQNEVSFMEKASHESLVPIIHSDLESKSPWFLMPFATSSLRRQIKEKPANNQRLTQALYDILSGLKCMHEMGFYHRDMCCANVLAFLTDKGIRYKISDFGAVTQDGSNGPFFKIDSGHYRYAPPEITVGPMIGSSLSDIYGFGAILHEIFGEHPREAKKCIDTEVGPLGEIMKNCTHENPENRYPDIQSVYKDLMKALPPSTS